MIENRKKRKIDLEKLRNEVIEINNNKNKVEEIISQIKAKLEKVQEQINATDNTWREIKSEKEGSFLNKKEMKSLKMKKIWNCILKEHTT